MAGQENTLDVLVPKARAWAVVMVSPAWWLLPGEDRNAHRSGVELAFRTNRRLRRSELCTPCWLSESRPDILYCDGGTGRNFKWLLQTLA